MLQDSDTNVYEDQHVHIPETVEFNIRGKKQKVLSKKEKAKQEAKIRMNLRRKQIRDANEKKIKKLDAAPKTLTDGQAFNTGIRNNANPYDFVAKEEVDVDLGLGSDLSGDDSDGDFGEYNKRVEQEKKRRREELG